MRLLKTGLAHGSKAAYFLAIAVILAVGLFEFLAFSPLNNQNATPGHSANECSIGFPSPALAPEPGFSYFAYYNATNGAILSVETRPSCQVNGLPTVSPYLKGQVNVLNVTTSPYIPDMMPNGYLNAFYVNTHSVRLTMKPGVVFTDPYHAFYEGQPITDATQIPIPTS